MRFFAGLCRDVNAENDRLVAVEPSEAEMMSRDDMDLDMIENGALEM